MHFEVTVIVTSRMVMLPLTWATPLGYSSTGAAGPRVQAQQQGREVERVRSTTFDVGGATEPLPDPPSRAEGVAGL